MCRKLSLFLILFFLNLRDIYAQDSHGISFDSTSSWNEILEKAKNEHKFIFVDCYATWCGPCKMMDKDIYSLDSVGQFYNSNFIPIKLQINKTPNDNEYVKSWYSTAEFFVRNYQILGFPGFLFFSSEGELVHKDAGFKSPKLFLDLGKNAIDPSQQYFSLTQKYKSGKMTDKDEIRKYIDVARRNGDRKYSIEIAAKYKHAYLDKLSIDQLCNLSDLDFARNYMSLITSKDNFFKLCYKFPKRVDSIYPDLSSKILLTIIEKDEITNKIWDGKLLLKYNPNWVKFNRRITRKYGKEYADKLIFNARKRFAFKVKKWNEFVSLKDAEIAKFSPNNFEEDAWRLNVDAWNTYLNCGDSSTLRVAVSWCDLSIKMVSIKTANFSEQCYDTKAHLLYKMGRIEEAIENEQLAIDTGDRGARLNGGLKGAYSEDYKIILNRMKNREPISDLD